MKKKLFNFFVTGMLCAVVFSACDHKLNSDGGGGGQFKPL